MNNLSVHLFVCQFVCANTIFSVSLFVWTSFCLSVYLCKHLLNALCSPKFCQITPHLAQRSEQYAGRRPAICEFSKLENLTTFLRHKFQNFDGDFITILVIDTSLDLYPLCKIVCQFCCIFVILRWIPSLNHINSSY